MIKEHLRPVFVSFTLLTLVTGIFYPLFVTGIAGIFFKSQANGSLLYKEGRPVGSVLIGQSFTDPKYFWSRPSATGPAGFNGAASSGSNYGPANTGYLKAVEARIKNLKEADPGNAMPVPVDLVTASASGLDPHISIAAARYQIMRVSKTRNLDPKIVSAMVDFIYEEPQFDFLGEARVNVLKLNFLLDEYEKNPGISLKRPDTDQLPETMKWGNWENPRNLN